jgi:hypothetical protein
VRHLSILLLTLALVRSAAAETAVIGVDPGDPAYQKQIEAARELHEKKNKKKKRGWFGRRNKKKKSGGGDVQVGVDVNPPKETPVPATKRTKSGKVLREMTGSTVPGIFPVYEASKRWMLVERMPKGGKRKRLVTKGTRLLVIGSEGIAQFYAQRATTTYIADCENLKAKPMRAYYLSAKSAKAFRAVGRPVIAIKLPKGRKVNTSRAKFAKLPNAVDESVYQELEAVIRDQVVSDVKSGAFQTELDDPGFLRFESQPDPKSLQMKIDYSSRLGFRGFTRPKIAVEGVQISKAYRRCLRFFDEAKPVGSCVEMPHELMSETAGLEFVTYDPSGRGRPFLLAYTKGKPLWGDERWGFQLSTKGPKLFLQDALDTRCREAF